ncbi:MAG: acyltransferase family protein [Gammaproteobacteria bacterium]
MDWVDYAKGIGISLVVYGHVLRGIYHAALGLSEAFFFYSDSIVYSFHMPLFFFLSGLFVRNSLSTRGGLAFLTEKLRLIVYPYFIWSLLQGGVEVVFSDYTNGNATVAELWRVLYQPRAQFWFLYSLLWMYGLYLTAATLRSPSYVLLLVSMVLLYYPVESPLLGLSGLFKNLIYFVLGTLLLSSSLTERADQLRSSVIAVAVMLFAVLEGVTFYEAWQPGATVCFSLAIIGIASAVLVSMQLAKSGRLVWICTVGRYSMPIYLAHILTGNGLRIGLQKLLGLQDPGVHLLAGVVVGLAMPIVVYRLSRTVGFPYLFELRQPRPAESLYHSGTGCPMPPRRADEPVG